MCLWLPSGGKKLFKTGDQKEEACNATVPLQLHLDIQTGFITTEDGLQIISTLKPLESPSCQTLRGKSFTSDWVHGQRIMSSHLETEIVKSSGKVVQQSGPSQHIPRTYGGRNSYTSGHTCQILAVWHI